LPFNTWGTFRGLHYFGLKTSSPNSPAVGLIWFNNNAKDVNSLHLRHWCNSGDNLKYGWKLYNFNDFGYQQIVDNDYTLNTSFIKFSENYWRVSQKVD
jgi:mannosyl-oligosaccharide glucosidase